MAGERNDKTTRRYIEGRAFHDSAREGCERGRRVADEVAIPRVGGTIYRNKWRRARCWAPANGNVKLWKLRGIKWVNKIQLNPATLGHDIPAWIYLEPKSGWKRSGPGHTHTHTHVTASSSFLYEINHVDENLSTGKEWNSR